MSTNRGHIKNQVIKQMYQVIPAMFKKLLKREKNGAEPYKAWGYVSGYN